MNKILINALMVNDDDLECKNDKTTLTDLNLNNLNFKLEDIEGFDLIVYRGKKGTKILKSNYFKVGKIT